MLYLYTLQLEKLEKKGYKLYMNQIKPMLLTTLKSYDRSQFVKDVTAGIIVAIIALPLASHLGVKEVATDPLCQYTGAIGAAVLGIRKIK